MALSGPLLRHSPRLSLMQYWIFWYVRVGPGTFTDTFEPSLSQAGNIFISHTSMELESVRQRREKVTSFQVEWVFNSLRTAQPFRTFLQTLTWGACPVKVLTCTCLCYTSCYVTPALKVMLDKMIFAQMKMNYDVPFKWLDAIYYATALACASMLQLCIT